MPNIFVDCGACKSEVTNQHLHNHQGEDWAYRLFEPNPKLYQKLVKWHAERSNVKVHNKAVWVKDGNIDFFLGSRQGSTLIKQKVTGLLDKEHPIKAPCINFSSWLKRIPEDYFVEVKMDIEGAEYQVLDKLIREETIYIINKLTVEFHQDRIADPNIHRMHDHVVDWLRKEPKIDKTLWIRSESNWQLRNVKRRQSQ